MATPRIVPRLLLAAVVTAFMLVAAECSVRAVRDPRRLERQEQREIFP